MNGEKAVVNAAKNINHFEVKKFFQKNIQDIGLIAKTVKNTILKAVTGLLTKICTKYPMILVGRNKSENNRFPWKG